MSVATRRPRRGRLGTDLKSAINKPRPLLRKGLRRAEGAESSRRIPALSPKSELSEHEGQLVQYGADLPAPQL